MLSGMIVLIVNNYTTHPDKALIRVLVRKEHVNRWVVIRFLKNVRGGANSLGQADIFIAVETK
jgi:hypothetical protein